MMTKSTYISIISHSFLLRMRNVSDRICRGIQDTHFVFSNFFSEYRIVYETMWEKLLDPHATGDNIIWHMRIACWISMATHRHSDYVILTAFPMQQ